MNILVACEFSGIVRDAFIRAGHNAVSCDLLPTERPISYYKNGEQPGFHYRGDVRDILDETGWDMIIAFPPCTHLSSSGAAWFAEKRKDGRQQQGIDFFLLFTKLSCPKVAIENPVGIMSTHYHKPDQIIQPWQFGHPESKATCLWLKGLPLLQPTNVLTKPESGRWENQTPSGQNKLGPSATRAMDRSRTYMGIAEAMAAQWGKEKGK